MNLDQSAGDDTARRSVAKAWQALVASPVCIRFLLGLYTTWRRAAGGGRRKKSMKKEKIYTGLEIDWHTELKCQLNCACFHQKTVGKYPTVIFYSSMLKKKEKKQEGIYREKWELPTNYKVCCIHDWRKARCLEQDHSWIILATCQKWAFHF